MWSAEGNRASNTLTGADGLYNGRSVSRQNQPPIMDSVEIWRVCASAVVGPPLNWAILKFLVKELGGATVPPYPMPVCLQFGTERGGKRARAWRIENSPARGGDTRTLFEGVKGKSVLVSRQGETHVENV